MRVLFVDDYDDTRELFAELLTARGYHVFAAATGADALELAAAGAPQLAIIDLNLPDLDGVELAHRVRALPGLATIAIIAVTGRAAPEDLERSAAAGIDLHLVKPVSITRLLAAVTSLAARSAPDA